MRFFSSKTVYPRILDLEMQSPRPDEDPLALSHGSEGVPEQATKLLEITAINNCFKTGFINLSEGTLTQLVDQNSGTRFVPQMRVAFPYCPETPQAI